MGLDWVEISVAIGPVDDGMKLGVQGNRMPARLEAEIRRIRLTLHHDAT